MSSHRGERVTLIAEILFLDFADIVIFNPILRISEYAEHFICKVRTNLVFLLVDLPSDGRHSYIFLTSVPLNNAASC